MAKIFILLVFVVGVYLELSTSTNIQCDFKTTSWDILTNIYSCEVKIDPYITTQESATITSISGNHESGKTNSDVLGFYIQHKTCHYFPRGLETFFKNIKAIQIFNSKLKEIHQEDLKPFPKLVELHLYPNLLEILEEGLFDFNPDLEFIDFVNNRIVHIEPNVFDHLSKLSSLDFQGNACINKRALSSISEVKNIIQSSKVQCINSDFSSLKEKLEIFEKESQTLNSDELYEKFARLEQIFKGFEFANFRPLNYKFNALKKPKFENIVLTKTSDLATKLDNMSNSMIKVTTDINDLKSSQIIPKEVIGSIDGFGLTLSALKTGQSSIVGSINQVCTKESLGQVKDIQGIILESVNKIQNTSVKNEIDFENYQSYFNTTIGNLQESTRRGLNDISALDSKVNNLKSSQDDIKSSIGDIEASLSGLKSSQTELKTSITKIKNSQNEVKVLMDEIKVNKDEDAEDKFKLFSDEVKGHQKDIEGQLADFKVENGEKLAHIEKELTNTRHKIAVIIDEKIKGIEKRLMKKFEDVLEEKLRKILQEK